MKTKEDLYVIGFPKSGNTWLSRMLAEVTNSKIYVHSKSDIINSSENSNERNGDYLIHKIHYTYDLERVMKAKKVYIIRDIRDSIVSGFFHNYRRYKEDDIKNSALLSLLFNYEAKGINKQWQGPLSARINARTYLFLKRFLLGRKKAYVGNWSDHVNYWTNLDNIVIVRYEDILEHTKEEFTRIVKELKLNVSDDDIKNTIENQSFSKKKAEFIKKGDFKNAEFLRSGKKESWKNLIDLKLQTIIEKEHYKTMKKFNYKVETI